MKRAYHGGDHPNGDGPTDDGAGRDPNEEWITCAGIVLLVALALVVRLLVGEFFGV